MATGYPVGHPPLGRWHHTTETWSEGGGPSRETGSLADANGGDLDFAAVGKCQKSGREGGEHRGKRSHRKTPGKIKRSKQETRWAGKMGLGPGAEKKLHVSVACTTVGGATCRVTVGKRKNGLGNRASPAGNKKTPLGANTGALKGGGAFRGI